MAKRKSERVKMVRKVCEEVSRVKLIFIFNAYLCILVQYMNSIYKEVGIER
jgi:hypothetical protein